MSGLCLCRGSGAWDDAYHLFCWVLRVNQDKAGMSTNIRRELRELCEKEETVCMLMCSSRRSFDSSGNPRQRTSLACHVILANKRLSSRQKDCRQWKSALDLLNGLVHSLPVLWFAAWFWCVQCSGSHGQQRFFRKTEVWHRWWKPTVLPVQLEMSRHDTWTGSLYSHFFVRPLLAQKT